MLELIKCVRFQHTAAMRFLKDHFAGDPRLWAKERRDNETILDAIKRKKKQMKADGITFPFIE